MVSLKDWFGVLCEITWRRTQNGEDDSMYPNLRHIVPELGLK